MTFGPSVALAAAILAVSTAAQPLDQTFTYQGELLDNGELATGLYDFGFQLFTDAAGQFPTGQTIFNNNVQVTDGYVETDVNFGPVFASGNKRWLEVSVRAPSDTGPFTPLGLQELTATPYASNAIRADFALTSATTLGDAYARGRTIDAVSGAVRIINSDTSGDASIELGGSGSQPAEIRLFDTSGSESVELRGGTVGGRLTISGFGGFPFIRLDPNASGDSAAVLPSASINAFETSQEAGAAGVVRSSSVSINGATPQTVTSRSISCPTDGVVLAIATAEVTFFHSFLLRSSMTFGITDGGPLGSAQDVELALDPDHPNGDYDTPVTVHGLFPVSAGTNTFSFVASELGGQNHQVLDSTLSLIFVPTAYGDVTGSRSPSGPVPDHATPVEAPLTELDILAERQQALILEQQRVQAEIDRMRAEANARSQGDTP
ncbi:MAG: hypothetical protein AAFN41_06020 [Planctomycetota bacterium]